MDVLVERPNERVTCECQGRDLRARRHDLAKALKDCGHRSRLISIGAKLVDVTQILLAQRRRKRRRLNNFILLRDDEFVSAGRPLSGFPRLLPDPLAILETFVGPHMNDHVQTAHLRAPKPPKLGELLARSEALHKTFLKGRRSSRLERIGTHFDKHKIALLCYLSLLSFPSMRPQLQ